VLHGVPFEVNLNTLWNQAFAAFLAAVAQNAATGFGGHAGTETKLVFAGAFGGLIGAFAHGLGLNKGS
jgi:hypothetical protein